MKSTKVKEPRNTVLIRVEVGIRDAVKMMSQRLKIRMSRIVDVALTNYLKLIDRQNKSNKLPK
jgi:hypothetical protein